MTDCILQYQWRSVLFYLPYLSSIDEKANCIAILWTVSLHSLGSCLSRGLWVTCLPHKGGESRYVPCPKTQQANLPAWLLDRRKTSVGTLQSNRKAIPAEIREIKDRETNSYEIYWKKNNVILNLHSYVVKTKSEQCHRFLQLQKMTTKASPLFTNYTTFQKAKQISLTKKWGSTVVHRNQSAGL